MDKNDIENNNKEKMTFLITFPQDGCEHSLDEYRYEYQSQHVIAVLCTEMSICKDC